MPGGRNSGAVYNLYKVKYKKHKKANNKQQQQQQKHLHHHQQHTNVKLEMPLVKNENSHHLQTTTSSNQQQPQQILSSGGGGNGNSNTTTPNNNGGGSSTTTTQIPSHLVNGTILKTALTNPSEVVHLRQRLDNAVSSSRDRNYSIENTLTMVQTLIDCDEFQDIATLQNIEELLDNKSDLSEKLCQIGDSIVYKLVQWTKRLPFYLELPVEVHTRLLTHKWHELLVLTTSAYQAIHGQQQPQQKMHDNNEIDFTQEVSKNSFSTV